MKDTSWGGVAEWYDGLLENEDTYQAKVILPNLTRLLDIKKGDKILDLGCGQGFFARAFEGLGAEIKGVDIGDELINIARNKSKHSKTITYYLAPSHKIGFIEDQSIDKIVIVLAIQNIEKMKETFDECKRVLKPGGKFLLVMNHPAFRIPKRSAWGFDEEKKVQYRRIDGYLSETKEEMEMHPGRERGPITISFHRPLQVYFKSLQKAGFTVARLEEWDSHKKSEKGKRSVAENNARKEIPLFLCLEGRLTKN